MFVLLTLLSASGIAYAQRIDVAFNIGYATFNAAGLKTMQDVWLTQMPEDAAITNAFPGYLNYRVEAVFFDSTYYVGIVLGHTSTGGRIQYADYSGAATADQLVVMNYTGFVAARRVASTSFGDIFLGGNVSIYRNKVDLKYSEVIYDTEYSSSSKYESFNLALGASAQVQKRFGRLYVKGSAGYEAHIAMDLYFGDPDNKYIMSTGETVKVNADGLRIDIGVGYTVYTRK